MRNEVSSLVDGLSLMTWSVLATAQTSPVRSMEMLRGRAAPTGASDQRRTRPVTVSSSPMRSPPLSEKLTRVQMWMHSDTCERDLP